MEVWSVTEELAKIQPYDNAKPSNAFNATAFDTPSVLRTFALATQIIVTRPMNAKHQSNLHLPHFDSHYALKLRPDHLLALPISWSLLRSWEVL